MLLKLGKNRFSSDAPLNKNDDFAWMRTSANQPCTTAAM